MADFDFEYWSELAEQDPGAFFRARRQAIDEMIAAHPPAQRERLQEMQGRIDCMRASAGCPAQAVGSLCVMIQERLSALRRHQEELGVLAAGLRDALRGGPSA
jgi:uncharacterized protein DUF3135